MDVEDIRPGQDFAQTIDQTLGDCSAMLVVIGPKWIEILRARSKEQQEDYVAHEIEAALARKINIIPVLVGGANITQLSNLPKELAALPFHQAVELHDTSFKEDCERLAKGLGPRASHKGLALWLGSAAALVILLLALTGPWKASRERKIQIHQLLTTAQTQTKLAEYEAAFKTYGSALKIDPMERNAQDGQVDAAMLWLENFHVAVAEGQKVEDLAGPPLAQMMTVLDAGFARANGRLPRAADILAHIGWAHWLNQHIAYLEFGHAAEQALRQALALDLSNVYANAMLGNWLLQTHGSLQEALHCFDIALKSGKQRPLVREMQLGGMIYNDDPGVPAELIRVADQMRVNGEPMDERFKSRLRAP
jgi:tetratricopeptide (TPR) repeat protein